MFFCFSLFFFFTVLCVLQFIAMCLAVCVALTSWKAKQKSKPQRKINKIR